MSHQYPTSIAGRPARIDHTGDLDTPRYRITVALDGHEHLVILDRADGTPVAWRLMYMTPLGWHLDHDGHGTAPTPRAAVTAADAHRTADVPREVNA